MILGFISAAIVLCIMKAFVTDYYTAKAKNITVRPEAGEQDVDDIESGGQYSTSNETPHVANHSIHPIPEESEEKSEASTSLSEDIRKLVPFDCSRDGGDEHEWNEDPPFDFIEVSSAGS